MIGCRENGFKAMCQKIVAEKLHDLTIISVGSGMDKGHGSVFIYLLRKGFQEALPHMFSRFTTLNILAGDLGEYGGLGQTPGHIAVYLGDSPTLGGGMKVKTHQPDVLVSPVGGKPRNRFSDGSGQSQFSDQTGLVNEGFLHHHGLFRQFLGILFKLPGGIPVHDQHMPGHCIMVAYLRVPLIGVKDGIIAIF